MAPSKSRASILLPALVVLVGLLLRVGMLGVNVRFHPDEALFAAQARLISADGDVLLRTTDLDKPPLTFYTTALAFEALDAREFAARLPNVFFSTLSVALLYRLGLALFRSRRMAVWAALLLALSPFHLAFAATAFTDIQATFWVLAAALCAVRDRWRLAGVAAALMFAAKPTALAFLPLIVTLGLAANAAPDWSPRQIARRLAAFAMPLAIGAGLIWGWDLARAPRSFWSLGCVRNNPGRLIRSDEIMPRLKQWLHWLRFGTGSPPLNIVLLSGGIARLGWDLRRWRARQTALDWLIAGFGIAFLAWYWLVAYNTYDRYLHPLIPFALLLAARVLASATRPWLSAGIAILVLAAILPGTARTLRGDAPLGGDQGQNTGIDAVAENLNTELRGEVVYDHWLGYELAYYLGPEPAVTLRFMALPEALADDMMVQGSTRYFAAPSLWEAAPWLDALRQADIGVEIVFQDDHGFAVFRLTPPENGQQTGGAVYSE